MATLQNLIDNNIVKACHWSVDQKVSYRINSEFVIRDSWGHTVTSFVADERYGMVMVETGKNFVASHGIHLDLTLNVFMLTPVEVVTLATAPTAEEFAVGC